ncbi:MAG: hypothetical protein WC455_14975 [Dehalococcoidia bacterium]|jgi:hypothetical protein
MPTFIILTEHGGAAPQLFNVATISTIQQSELGGKPNGCKIFFAGDGEEYFRCAENLPEIISRFPKDMQI